MNLGWTCWFAHCGPACVAAGAGELHLEICLKDLQDDFMGGAEVRRMCLLCVLPLLPYIARKLLDWLVTGCRLFWLGRSALSLCTLPAFLTLAFFSMSPPIYKNLFELLTPCQLFCRWLQIRVSEPVVAFRETVSEASDHTVMSKSPNKHNRLYLQARPMEDGLAEAIDEGKVGPKDDPKVRDGDGTQCSDLSVCMKCLASCLQSGLHALKQWQLVPLALLEVP